MSPGHSQRLYRQRRYRPASIALAAALWLIGCGAGSSSNSGAGGDPKPPPFPSDFKAPPPLPEPQPVDPGVTGRAYLAQIQSSLQEPWGNFLETCRMRLPPDHALNQTTLEVGLALAIGRDGSLSQMDFHKRSGLDDFDQVAAEIAQDAAPFPAPPGELISDDGKVHLVWLFARDRRQAGASNAELRRVEWPVERSIPMFLDAGEVTIAASRLARAAAPAETGSAQSGSDDTDSAALVALGKLVAAAAIRQGLDSDDAATLHAAVTGAAAGELSAAAPRLRELVKKAIDAKLRNEIIAALATLGDKEAIPLLLDVLRAAPAGNGDQGAAAANALATLDQRAAAEAVVTGWLDAGDESSMWAALRVMAEFPVPAAVSRLAQMAADSARPRPARAAACVALGNSSDRATAGQSMKVLRSLLGSDDAKLRAACAEGITRAARRGVTSRLTYWSVADIMKKDRDERVRAAALSAAAHLEPSRFHREMFGLQRDRSKLVKIAWARALGHTEGPEAVGRLVLLLRDGDPAVRQAAAHSLLERREPAARQAMTKLLDDSDPVVRTAAIAASNDTDRLAELLDDPAPRVRAAALSSLVKARGHAATLTRFARGTVDSDDQGVGRVVWADSWHSPRP